MRRSTRDGEDGVILINVLVILALAGTVLYAMLTLADVSIARGQAFGDGSQAMALVRAGEQSAIVALRRDMIEAPDTDHPGEPWGATQQKPIAIAGGTFELRIEDAQDKINLNTLMAGGLRSAGLLNAIAASIGLPERDIPRVLNSLAIGGPPPSVSELASRAGLDTKQSALLEQLVTIEPGTGGVNINTASEEVIGVLLGNQAKGHILARIRAGDGYLTQDDVDTAQVILPPGLGFRSNLFRVVTTVRLGGVTRTIRSLLRRHDGSDGPAVSVVSRENALTGVPPPPIDQSPS